MAIDSVEAGRNHLPWIRIFDSELLYTKKDILVYNQDAFEMLRIYL